MLKIKVYYEDTDASGRVYYANYLKYLERGRTEFLYKINLNHNILKNKYDIIFVVKNCYLDFKKPAYFEDIITVETKISQITKVKVSFDQAILKDNKILLIGNISIVPINHDGKINFLTDKLINLLNNYK